MDLAKSILLGAIRTLVLNQGRRFKFDSANLFGGYYPPDTQ